ncbi:MULTISPECIES: phage tail protein [unclassified Sphingobium]|uniref:phage tail protein n=1 Tax=unclassified Sphingobium TaxID=2611147 RepID=UPI002224DFA7|nr:MULTISPECIES: phage tail protein [unclassified Sphingobium]MCW2396164.1 hypothetical protein [Sphingobium sp. B8D3B]MCW2419680.1 hypothetical protein [Sphingobium sp. B8D3C]
MKKPASLRAHLTAYLPELQTQPDRLAIYVESGSVRALQSRSHSYEFAYKLQVGLWDFAGSADSLMLPLLIWLETEQPERLRDRDATPFTFETELLDSDTSDILISIDLTERVIAKPREDGTGFDLEHPAEPPVFETFPGIDNPFIQGWGGTEPLEASKAPGTILTPAIPPDA